ncbi:hypothetical protein QBC33DRAFT_473722 [Phialemonium atrogriseum]|uniref:Uncharacterized protein n=1 Tax=Phialemonium atrogriseum TaxID=1093897 RepID=A0AAJ0BXV9_9PEZI|nr:uncharacterized protein QBC33DRAFT_473722 [Phialemonium atrogriseum]KAK1766505.1 hypothetical protein QBC33DRAFT_473722 [Phialemonium atrogriseum]
MAPSKISGNTKPRGGGKATGSLSKPFKLAPETLQPFTLFLSKKHVYITHIDSKPRPFKRKIFAVPVLLNVVVALLFLCRMYYIGPYYLDLLASALGYSNSTSVDTAGSTWGQLALVVLRRSFTFLLDFCLVIFVWPWPAEFALGRTHGNPVRWRWNVGFRDQEIYVRRSRSWGQHVGDVLANAEGRNALMTYVRLATSPMLLQEKTGYLTMNGEWDLDWAAMVKAHALVDDKAIALDAFRTLVLIHHREFGWLCIDMNLGGNPKEEDRRRQVFAFRDALAAVGKEDLFFRWIEIVQFEASQPGGFGEEKQVEVAQRIRDLFQANGLDFDEFWRESVGSEASAGLS